MRWVHRQQTSWGTPYCAQIFPGAPRAPSKNCCFDLLHHPPHRSSSPPPPPHVAANSGSVAYARSTWLAGMRRPLPCRHTNSRFLRAHAACRFSAAAVCSTPGGSSASSCLCRWSSASALPCPKRASAASRPLAAPSAAASVSLRQCRARACWHHTSHLPPGWTTRAARRAVCGCIRASQQKTPRVRVKGFKVAHGIPPFFGCNRRNELRVWPPYRGRTEDSDVKILKLTD